MAQENIQITLPKSGLIATIRPFVRNRDRKAVQRELFASQKYDLNELKEDSEEMKMLIGGEALIGTAEAQCRRLLISVGDNTENPYDVLLDSPHEEDIITVEKAVNKIFEKGRKDRPKE